MNPFDKFVGVFLGYRKFMVILLLMIIGVEFRIKNLIDGAQLVDLLKSTCLAFIGGNAAEHFTNMAREWIQSQTNTPAAPAVAQANSPEQGAK